MRQLSIQILATTVLSESIGNPIPTVGDERNRNGEPPSDHLPTLDVADASNVLVLGSPMDSLTLEAGLSLLAGERPAEARVIWVTMLNTADDVVELWDEYFPTRPERLRVVLVGGGLTGNISFADPSFNTARIQDPSDLTTLGVRILETLSVWGREDGPIALRLDSLTPLLQYVDPRVLGQFLHTLTSRLSDAGVTAHFHIDPMAHDSRTIHALGSICDAQVHVDGGEVAVTVR